ncbi:MAG TPA: hypothetical protein DIC23_15750 [Planctomycetaceae bacterium]|nr:hypothetical protein [Planctomycetaceae bacterium]
MSIETQPFEFLDAIQHWGKAVTAFLVLVIIAACGLSLLTHGKKGPLMVLRWIPRFFADLLQLSPRRVYAIAQLTFREAIRRKALVVFGMFALLFMFGSWFMDNPNERMDLQVKNYISFVLTAITWLLLPVVLLISCWGLPEDIRNRSLHTVVTKPARKTEIVIGRMLGFSSLMTILVVVMGATGYIWIDREVAHNLTVYSQSFERDGQETLVEYVEGNEGVTVRVTAGENPTTVTTAPTRQALRQDNPDLFNLTELARVAALKRHLVAKRPVLGTLSFKGADGSPTELGVNTGDIWEYRTYIAGGTQWRAIWDFENITEEVISRAKGLRLESSFEAFRTHKGDNIQASLLLQYTLVKIDRSVFRDSNDRPVSAAVVRKTGENSFEATVDGQVMPVTPVPVSAHELMVKGNTYVLVDDPDVVVRVISKASVPLPSFNISEFGENVTLIPSQIDYYDQNSGERRQLDLIKDLVNDRQELRVEVACLDSGQYLGMAQRDLFVQLPSNSFAIGYAKAICGIWLMLGLIVVIGVTSSCFLKGPVSSLLTLVMLLVGQGFKAFLEKIVEGDVEGGGPIESVIRIIRQINLTDDLPETTFYSTVKSIDSFLNEGLFIVENIVPDFRSFQMDSYIANGFDVPWSQALAPSIGVALAYLVPCLIIAYYSLSLRELEHK